MYNEKDDIEKLFSKKFEQFEISSSESEWLELSSRLSRANFLKFSFATFNVYYLMVLVAFAGTATFTGINNSILERKLNRQEEKIQTYHKEKPQNEKPAIVIDSTRFRTPEIQTPKQPENKEVKHPAIIIKKETETEVKEPVHPDMPAKDTMTKSETGTVPLVDTASKTKVKRIKKTLVIKPTVVVVKDTVIVTNP